MHPNQWERVFRDWNNMTLKGDLERDVDFKLVNQTVWQKLIYAFGGAPEISFFQVTEARESGSVAEPFPDLNPIKIEVQCSDYSFTEDGRVGVMISSHITTRTFLNYISQLFSLSTSKVILFAVEPDESGKHTLVEISAKPNC